MPQTMVFTILTTTIGCLPEAGRGGSTGEGTEVAGEGGDSESNCSCVGFPVSLTLCM